MKSLLHSCQEKKAGIMRINLNLRSKLILLQEKARHRLHTGPLYATNISACVSASLKANTKRASFRANTRRANVRANTRRVSVRRGSTTGPAPRPVSGPNTSQRQGRHQGHAVRASVRRVNA